MTEYKDTLNLPHTSFPMKANLAEREPKRLSVWEMIKLTEKITKFQANKPVFTLHDGPPYANGHLHCGHALNKILKDMIVKSKSLSGFKTPFIPGWDCHGLPIELNVEKKVGKAGKKISHADFRRKCREYAQTQIDIQREEFKRLGVFAQWDKPYTTFDFGYEANTVRALGKIIKNGHLKQGFKPVHWCIDCGSALAEAEVDYEEKCSTSIDVAFKALDPDAFFKVFELTSDKNTLIVPIWTTTPWSLPANEAVCVHPEFEYALVDTTDNWYVLAADLVETTMARFGIKSYQVMAKTLGKKLAHLELAHPFMQRAVPMIYGKHVTTDSGTGCVHTAPAHGPEDYEVGKAFNLPLFNPVQSNGCYKADTPFLGNQSVLKVNEAILTLLKERQTLLFEEMITHSYPHCWRHKTPMIFLATPQWFIAMDDNNLRQQMLNTLSSVTWLPEWGESRIRLMIENRPDWCISRQRTWGTPLPLFVHNTTSALHPNTLELLEKVACLIEAQGIDAWFDLKAETLLGKDAQYYHKIEDTLDVWFDSGVSHFCVLKEQDSLSFPADLYLEGSDQHRGWFNSSLTTAVAMYGQVPYKTVLTHGYTVDAEGKKLSKSKGNYVDLDKLVKQYGADILRLWVSSTDYRHEVSISEDILKQTGDAYRRIRNTARFLLANLADFDTSCEVAASELVELDAWLITRAQVIQQEIEQAYKAYQFHVVYQKIHHFCTIDLGSFYLDVIKDRQYTTPKESLARRSCQTAMYHVIQALCGWLAPIISFTAEEIWQAIPGQTSESIFLTTWYRAWPQTMSVDMQQWTQLHNVRDEVNKAIELTRQQGAIGSGLMAEVTLYADASLFALLKKLGDELRFLLITAKTKILPLAEKPHHLITHAELKLAVDINASTHPKCARCWHRCAEVGEIVNHPELCQRCVDNITDKAEQRTFA